MIKKHAWITYPFYVMVLTCALCAQGQSVTEVSRSIKTYPYSDPNPVPSMAVNNNISRFYPYFMFDAYSNSDTLQNWKVVTLDNGLITVSVLPEVGGKVYGAIEKQTGQKFVYLNKVMKFRAIGSRGPWTSGGIEHNFGLDIGHAPWAASPVDYIIRKKDDGSVECVVGGLDLASRTQWRMTIRLPKNSAYFETKALLYNPTPYHHAYLSWENAAFKATDDLEFFFPGNHHIGHDGLANSWPIDEDGRDLSKYKNNNFGSSKSYHVMGSTRNWFGGLWQNNSFGFGHWAPYTDAPGKKLWIWSLARDGAIWEDLLTDNDGQYIEAQSGVKFNQADVVSGYHSPFKQLSLRPGYAETKYETWFPVKGLKAIVDATGAASMNVTRNDSIVAVSISPNTRLTDTLYVVADGKLISRTTINLQPLKLFKTNVSVPVNAKEVEIGTVVSKLRYNSSPQYINRPVVSPGNYEPDDAQRLFVLAEDKNSMRLFDEALELYKKCVEREPSHTEALARIAELLYRKTEDEEAEKYALRALSINMYDASSNYIYGVIARRRGNLNEAEEGFSVAVRTFEYRSDAYRQLAELAALKSDFNNAAELAQKSLAYNRNNIAALQILSAAHRKTGNVKLAEAARKALLDVDPLNHFARFERYLQATGETTLREFRAPIQNEFPHESYLELAVTYATLGLKNEAIKVLKLAPSHPMVSYWLAYLQKENKASTDFIAKADNGNAKFVFPFREESIPVLEYAISKSASWKPKYYLAMIYWSKGANAKALAFMRQCGNTPDFAPFYLSRAKLQQNENMLTDLKKALSVSPGEWRTYQFLADYLSEHGNFEEAEKVLAEAATKFPHNVVVNIGYSKALLNVKKYEQCLAILKDVYVLPQEHANQGHSVYEQANIALGIEKIKTKAWDEAASYLANAKKWPENLGSGEPYDPDNRLPDLLLAYCAAQNGNMLKAKEIKKGIADYTLKMWPAQKSLANYIGLAEMKAAGQTNKIDQMLSSWKHQSDSLQKWGLPGGATGAAQNYVVAKIKNDPSAKELEEKLANSMDLSNRLFIEAIRIAYKND